jgi:hypothetical protein
MKDTAGANTAAQAATAAVVEAINERRIRFDGTTNSSA